MKIKIISDGTALGTKVINAETGEALDKVASVRFEVDWTKWGGWEYPTVELRIVDVPVELEAEVVNTHNLTVYH